MAHTAATASWQSITLTVSEAWVVEEGTILVHCFNSTTPTDDTDGATVREGGSVVFQAGQTVFYKAGRGVAGGDNRFARLEIGVAA